MKKQTIIYKGVEQPKAKRLTPAEKVRQSLVKSKFNKLKAQGWHEITTRQGTFLIDTIRKDGIALNREGMPAEPGLLEMFTGQLLIIGQGGVILRVLTAKGYK